MQKFNQLEVFKRAYILSKEIYLETKESKNLRLKSQLFGAATSIPANLAEMTGFNSKKQQAHKVQIAIAEAKELNFWIMFCKDVGEIDQKSSDVYIEEIEEIKKMLFGLFLSIKKDP